MPRIQYIEKRFNEQAQALIAYSNRIMDSYAKQGYDLSLRQLYYQLVASNVLPNVPKSYTFLGKVVNDARMAGLIDWEMIVDRGRLMQKPTLWSTPGNAINAMAKGFQWNKWKNQPFYIEVMVEKQALEGVIAPVCARYGIGFTANKGYSSASSLWRASQRFLRAYKRKKQVCVLYLGDHDPSGQDMTRDLRDRFQTFCGIEVDVKRIALNMSQVDKYNLPPNPAKMTDSRAEDYVAKHGDESWELDALPPQILANLVIAAVNRRLDVPQWETDCKIEKDMRRELALAAQVLDERYGKKVGPKVNAITDEDDENDQPPIGNSGGPTDGTSAVPDSSPDEPTDGQRDSGGAGESGDNAS
jgi:hypothetical protein